jgi:hypothetical protein
MHNLIYNIYGHSYYCENTNPENDPLNINIELEQNTNVIVTVPDINEITTDKLLRLKIILGFIYNALIIVLISWSIPYLIIEAFQMRTRDEIHNILFPLMFTTQYIIGLSYFNSESYKNNINKSMKLKKTFQLLTIISLFLVICMTIMTFLFIVYNVSIQNEGGIKIYNYSSGTYALLFFNKFYSYAAFFANMTLFFVLMHHNKKILNDYTNEIKEYIKSSYSLIDKVTSITIKFQEIKNEYDATIDSLNTFFSFLSIIGALGLYFVIISIFNGKFDSIQIINSCLFLLTEIMYVNTAQGLRSSIDEITNLIIKNPVLIQKYNQKERQYNMIINNDPYYDKREVENSLVSLQEICTVTYMCCKEMEEQLLWKKLDDMLQAEWNTFQFFGIKIKDTTLLQKILGLIITFIFTTNLINVADFNAFGGN